jgi:hypothetical protein
MELCIRCYQLVFSYAFLFSTAQTRLYSIRLRTTTLICPPPPSSGISTRWTVSMLSTTPDIKTKVDLMRR